MNQYPLWKYILLGIVLIFGVIYALPNLPQYGDDYAIQVSAKDSSPLTDAVKTDVVTTLQKNKIPYLKIQRQKSSYLIRFASNDAQTKAQDFLQATLGRHYSVALNLAPKTPKWLRALGAHPMKLGLDLRGGIHFLLHVDINTMLKQREKGDIHAMGNLLRQDMIRYANISANGKHGISIGFRSNDNQSKAQAVLKPKFPDYTFTTTQQGSEYLLHGVMSPAAITKLSEYAITQIVTTMRNRVNELGVAEPMIRQQGKEQISVDLPGIQDSARAKEMLGKVATIRMQLVDTQHDPFSAASSGIVPFGSTLYRFEKRPYLLKNQVILHGTSILNANASTDDNGRPSVSIRAGGSGVTLFNQATAENIGKPMAVVYIETRSYKTLEHGKPVIKQQQIERIINIATIQSALGGNFQITGLDSNLYAKNLSLLLRSGAYSAPVTYVQEQVVGPSLGAKNIRMGVLSCEIGSAFVILFMLLYYRFFGFVADLALVLNIVLLLAIMSLMGFTMTLPGIAALVLTVGMAVDANVLINERIREELRNGMTPQASIHVGYGRAFTTIVDANVTTLIVAVVLFALGTGSVQGFAVALIIGLLVSMLTAIMFTRSIINLVYGRKPGKALSIGIKIKAPAEER